MALTLFSDAAFAGLSLGFTALALITSGTSDNSKNLYFLFPIIGTSYGIRKPPNYLKGYKRKKGWEYKITLK